MADNLKSFFNAVALVAETRGTDIVVAVFAIVFGILIIKNVMKIIKKYIVESDLDKSMVRLVLSLINFGLDFCLALYVLSKLGIGITGFVAVFSAFTLGIGLAIQDIVGGVANGLVIVSTKPFKIGDFVQIGSVTGTVTEISLMHTVLDTPDKTHVFLPNKTVYNSQILNFSANPIRRIDFKISVDHKTNIDLAMEKFFESLKENKLVLDSPSPKIILSSIGSSELVFTLRAWVKSNNYWDLYNDLPKKTFDVCRKNNIIVPHTQITVFNGDEKNNSNGDEKNNSNGDEKNNSNGDEK